MGVTNVILNPIQIDGPNTMSGPLLKPSVVELLVVNRHDARNAAPLFGSRIDSESTICSRLGDELVDESNTVSIREIDVSCRDRIEVLHRKSVDEVRIPRFGVEGN